MPFMKDEMKKKDAAILDEMEKEIEEASQPQSETAEASDIDTDALEAAKAALEQKTKEYQESNEQLMRLRADFDNFRRRTRQEKEELSAVVLQGILGDLLPVVDNFERAMAADAAAGDSFREGIAMVHAQLTAVLQKNGLEAIVAVGEKFDPNFHQAVMRVEDSSKEEDTIVEELQKGYMAHGRVIRPSMVKVVSN